MRRQTLFLLFMILFSLPLTVLAQGTKTVKGTVVDQNNEPIIGATVVVKGSTIGAATDLDGNYVLNGVPEDATLVFNYLGMLPQEISAAGQSVINVKLREDAQLLEEVVVIGYGSAKAKDLTAPIDVVKEKELINVPTSSQIAHAGRVGRFFRTTGDIQAVIGHHGCAQQFVIPVGIGIELQVFHIASEFGY